MLRPSFGGDVRDVPSDGEIAIGIGGIADGEGHTGVSLNVAHLLTSLNRVDDHPLTICVDPGLGRLRRAVGHQCRDEARVPTSQQLDEAVREFVVDQNLRRSDAERRRARSRTASASSPLISTLAAP